MTLRGFRETPDLKKKHISASVGDLDLFFAVRLCLTWFFFMRSWTLGRSLPCSLELAMGSRSVTHNWMRKEGGSVEVRRAQ